MNNNPTVLEIDSGAIKHNLHYFKSKINADTKVLVVIKAFAYGSDAVEIAKILEKERVDYLAVAYTGEGVSLRKANIQLPILVLHPQIENFNTIIEFDLEPNLYNFSSLNHFINLISKINKINYPVHLKINSGMNRLGFKENDIPQLRTILENNHGLKFVSFYSHLAASEVQDEKEFTKQQIDTFQIIGNRLAHVLNYKPLFHILNTSGIINYPSAQFDMVRLGIGLYGFSNEQKAIGKLKNVCNFKTAISQIQTIEKGETVSYNRKFKAKKTSRIAILPVGYADGLKRNLSNSVGSVYLKDREIPIVGTICMDITMVDVTDIDCTVGDEVIIFNHQNHILEFARKINTISYEILTSISQRVKRRLI